MWQKWSGRRSNKGNKNPIVDYATRNTPETNRSTQGHTGLSPKAG